MSSQESKKEKLPVVKKTTGTDKTKAFIANVFERNPVGRPRLYSTKEALEEQVKLYFVECYESKTKLTITGLILFCGFSDRKSFYEYEQKPEFTHTIKKARTLIELNYELMLQEAFPQGAVFALKNLGWNAEEKIESTVKKQTSFYVGGDDDEDEDFSQLVNYEDIE